MQPAFFSRNRERLTEAVGGGLVVLAGNQLMQRSNDNAFPFEQDANFWWLTGIKSPGWLVIIDGKKKRSYLVAPKVDEVHQTFDGSLSEEKARRISGVDKVVSGKEGNVLLSQYAQATKSVFTIGRDPHASHYDFELNPGPVKFYGKLKRLFKEVIDCRPDLAKLRAIKQPEEIAAIKHAVKLTVEAFERVKDQLPNLRHEYQVEAEFTHYFRSQGADGHAYDPIVAGGKNACTLHYNSNNQKLNRNELLLLDIGARVDGYAADITRTYAIGKPTKRQREVHAAVEKAHHKIVALLKPNLRIEEYLKSVDEIMQSTQRDLGLMAADNNYRVYFPHAISHGLGIDVHDSLGQPEEFLSGMILTVEPGIYIPEEGIGVRIEDDILITESGHENLSAALPTSL